MEEFNNIVGIGFLLFSGDKLMTIRELKAKPEYHKKASMLSFPLETVEPEKDKRLFDTICRLLKEELGISRSEVLIWGIHPRPFQLIPGRPNITTFYGTGLFIGDPHRKFKPEDDDIQIAGWRTPEQLLDEKLIRIEVEPILSHFATIRMASFI